MRFKVVVIERRLVREVWHVEADNATEAVELHHNGDSCFDEEEAIDVDESYVDHVVNLDDPTGDLELDEGL